MFNLGMPELIFIFVIALLIFGPQKLPELGKTFGRAIFEFKRATNELKDNFEKEAGTAGIKEELLKQQREIQAQLTQAISIPSLYPYEEANTPEPAKAEVTVAAAEPAKTTESAETANTPEPAVKTNV